MKFEFHKDMQGFSACQEVTLQLMEHSKERVLFCKCRKSSDFAGIMRTINLPKSQTYTLEVVGHANNLRTFLHVEDAQGKKMYHDYVLLGKTKRAIRIEFTPKQSQVRIGILMGGDSIATSNDYFMVQSISIHGLDKTTYLPRASDLRITRIYDTVVDLERERVDPKRNNRTPMEVGEYAILRDKTHENLYIYSRTGLEYVSKVGPGLPQFFGDVFRAQPGRILPLYASPDEAKEDLQAHPDKFYRPQGDYKWSSREKEINDDIYIYLDSGGYVRWLKLEDELREAESLSKLEGKLQPKSKLEPTNTQPTTTEETEIPALEQKSDYSLLDL